MSDGRNGQREFAVPSTAIFVGVPESGADMNQPASKEPTMDEILSSIRQIIADDDEAAAQKMPSPKAVALKPVPAPEPVPAPAEIDPFSDDDDDIVPPLALSPEQIVKDIPAEPEPEVQDEPVATSFEAVADLVMPDDIAFAQDKEEEPRPAAQPQAKAETAAAPKPAGFAQAAPMPDPDLSDDLVEELLEPATSAAVRSAFAKLDTPKLTPDLALGAGLAGRKPALYGRADRRSRDRTGIARRLTSLAGLALHIDKFFRDPLEVISSFRKDAEMTSVVVL
jgi:hypothetical protein